MSEIEIRSSRDLAGTDSAIDVISEKLRVAAAKCNLVAAASSAQPPPGCGVAFNVMRFTELDAYNVGGKWGLSASALMKVASAMRISWDGERSGRVDDGRDPRFCAYRAVGSYRSLDGQLVWVSGEVEIDMRDDSDQVAALRDRGGKGVERQIRDTRLFLVRHAETKAKARAIRQAAGIRGYTREELNKPFVVPSLVFTGHSDDPETKRVFAQEMARQMLGATAALFGGAPPPTPEPQTQEAALPKGDRSAELERLADEFEPSCGSFYDDDEGAY